MALSDTIHIGNPDQTVDVVVTVVNGVLLLDKSGVGKQPLQTISSSDNDVDVDVEFDEMDDDMVFDILLSLSLSLSSSLAVDAFCELVVDGKNGSIDLCVLSSFVFMSILGSPEEAKSPILERVIWVFDQWMQE